MNESPIESAKDVLTRNKNVLYGIFGHIRSSGYFPPREFLNEFLQGGNDPCDQDQRMGTWIPFELSNVDYQAVKQWWTANHPGAVESHLGAKYWSDWVQEILNP